MDKAVLADIPPLLVPCSPIAGWASEGDRRALVSQSEETDWHIREAYGRFIATTAAISWDRGSLSREEGIALGGLRN